MIFHHHLFFDFILNNKDMNHYVLTLDSSI